MKNLESLVRKLEKKAKENGATFVKLIKSSDVVVKDWVREKCMFGCKGFRWHCPPFAKPPKETREFLKDYNYCLLVGFGNLKKTTDNRKVQLTIFQLERICFLNGFYKAFGLTAGPCRICKKCNVKRNLKVFIRDVRRLTKESSKVILGALYKKFCKGIKIARPAMEAWGIDVYETVRRAGGVINVIKRRGEKFKSFGLVLIE